jgi:O-acetyl-ADP-ribose deacetylase (regulator of RNase III)
MAVLKLIQGDITEKEADILVNAANSALAGGGGVDGAIHTAAGPQLPKELEEIRRKLGGCPVGSAVVTSAGNLSAKWIIHAVAPIWQGGQRGERELLARAYAASLELAEDLGAQSIIFPSLGTGAYGIPRQIGAQIALKTIKEFFQEKRGIEVVSICLFSKADLNAYLSQGKLLGLNVQIQAKEDGSWKI